MPALKMRGALLPHVPLWPRASISRKTNLPLLLKNKKFPKEQAMYTT